jgi:hypothetical protein
MIFRDLEQKIVKIINESGLPVDAVYFIMKTLMQEVEQRYNEYCNMEDAAATQATKELDKENKESDSKIEESISVENKE